MNNNNNNKKKIKVINTTTTTAANKLEREKVSATNGAVQLTGEDYDASKLIGGVIEKGVTAPSSAPRLSVLPFPVARHRSHGPHWASNVGKSAVARSEDDDAYEDDDDEEDNDHASYDSIAGFAKPIKKKNKKGLDLSQWRDLVPSNGQQRNVRDNNNSVKMDVERRNVNEDSFGTVHDIDVGSVASVAVDISGHSSSDVNKASNENEEAVDATAARSNEGGYAFNEMDRVSSHDMLDHMKAESLRTFGSSRLDSVQGDTSIGSQIDAENRQLLERMSPEEIVEALEEIKDRFKPEQLKILRGKRKNSSPGSGSGATLALSDVQGDKHVVENGKRSSAPESNFSPVVTPSMQRTDKRSDESVRQNSASKGSSWDNWSERVENTRNLRFSMDGDVVEGSLVGETYRAENVAERDFLRTEGDPGAAGYTLKEALALTRSVVPGQRALALHLLASVLSKVLLKICESRHGITVSVSNENCVDWEAIWAYALGPEPELVLSLRMALDDNHNSVVLAAIKVIQSLLACDVNENILDKLEKMSVEGTFTAPIFRIRPDMKLGFLGGGFWKYSAKPSNIVLYEKEITGDQDEGGNTIQDDNTVASQDVAAGLVRMGILHRLHYLLQTDPTLSLEEGILSVLVAIARHSPVSARAVWKCEGLLQMVVDRYIAKKLETSKIKSVTLLRVLAQSSKSICVEFIKKGFFQIMTGQLFSVKSSIDERILSDKENYKLASELMIEQLRFWKVSIMYGCCISYFGGFLPTLCLWSDPLVHDKLVESNAFHEFSSVTAEVYLVLEALARRLPKLHLSENKNDRFIGSFSASDDEETWCWGDAVRMVEMALKWVELLMTDATLSHQENCVDYHNTSSILWIVAAIFHMLNTVLVKLKESSRSGKLLPDFAADIAIQIFKTAALGFSYQDDDEHSLDKCAVGPFLEKLCRLRYQSEFEVSVASVCCLHGLVEVTVSVDQLFQLTRNKNENKCFQEYDLSTFSRKLDIGILKFSLPQWRIVASEFMKLVFSERHYVQNIEVFSRGGPSPGVGVGWGAPGGGFWSPNVALVQADATFLVDLLEILCCSSDVDLCSVQEDSLVFQSINAALVISLTAGPGNRGTVKKVLDILLHVPVLKYLGLCISQFLQSYPGIEFNGEYTEADLIKFSELLGCHFSKRWLSTKLKKPKAKHGNGPGDRKNLKIGRPLDTIHEDMVTSPVTSDDRNSITVEWARQRLPLPSHWWLSPIVTIGDVTSGDVPNMSAVVQSISEFVEVSKAGLFFLLGIEALSSKLLDESSCAARSISVTWKLHSLSTSLLVGMDVLEDERSKVVFDALQCLYGQLLDKLQFSSTSAVVSKPTTTSENSTGGFGCLTFQTEIHESYSTFVETLVDQFAAVSYGDLSYGRQVAIYLHQQVEPSIRLATWNALSNAHALELLPPLSNCLSMAEGYLKPTEENDGILEAYIKSWVSGSLDRAATRGSMAYTLALHHLSSFIFQKSEDKRLLRYKIVKSLLRDYSRRQHHEAMMLDFVQHNQFANQKPGLATTSPDMDYLDQRFEILTDACESNSQLLTLVGKLRSSIQSSLRST